MLKALQTRTTGPKPPPPAKVIPVDKHAILGTWAYRHGGGTWTRRFTRDGYCVLRQGNKEVWKKPFEAVNEKTVDVEGRYRHVLVDQNTLKIEGRYTARRQ